MDDKKDVQQKDKWTERFDNRTLRSESFGTNISASRAYSRAERLSGAIHVVTNHIHQEEPAKMLSRRISLELLSALLILREEMRNAASPALKKVLDLIRTLISTVRILSVSGHVSAQNADTIVQAFDEVAHFLISSQKTALSESVSILKDDLFETGESLFKGHEFESRVLKVRRVAVTDRQQTTGVRHLNGDGKRARTERIVGILGAQGGLGIKDVAASLPEYSEKMIQRELKQLVSGGKVKKTGSKRWSIYTLA